MDTSKHSGYRDFIWAIELNRFGLEMTGLWPKFDKAAQSSLMSDLRMASIFSMVTLFLVIPLLWALVLLWGDMIVMIDILQTTLPSLIVPLKLAIMRWKRTAISYLIKMIKEDWLREKTDSERDVMINRARTGRLIVILGYCLMIFAFVMVIILPSFGLHFRYISNITDKDRLLPFQAHYIYDTNKTPQFELTLTLQALTMFLGSIAYTSIDAFLGVAIFHMCGQLENFRNQVGSMISSDEFYSALRAVVEAHLRLIRFSSNIEDTFSSMMLGLVFYFGIAFCLYGYFLIIIFTGGYISNMSLPRISFLVFGVILFLTHTFLYCGAGEIIADQCEAVYCALCDLEWYKLESKEKRNLILVILRANEPFHLTAGKLFPLTLTTFCSLLKTSAGYISFLLAKS